MKEPDFRDHRLPFDEQAEQICAITDNAGARGQDWRNTAGEQAASPLQELVAGDDDKAPCLDVGRSLYDQGPIFGQLPACTVLQLRHCTVPVFVDRDFDWRTAMRGANVND
jgi:hypothetical protein